VGPAAGNQANDIFAAGNDTCAVLTDGTVACWGDNSAGQLGDCTTGSRSTPAVIPDLQTESAPSMSPHRMCVDALEMAVIADSAVACWGPGPPTFVRGATSLSVVADDHGCGTAGGHVVCWGDNSQGQLGDGTTTSSQAAVTVADLPTDLFPFVVPGVSCAAQLNTQGGGLWCWGGNAHGQVGDGTTANRSRPVKLAIEPLDGEQPVGQLMFAMTDVGDLLCWGTGYCGDGTARTAVHPTPTKVPLAAQLMSIPVGGAEGACVQLADTSIWCWGSNSHGQVGDGTFTERLVPTALALSLEMQSAPYATADGSSFYMLNRYGEIYAWGRNDRGQLGDGTTTDRNTPVAIPGLANVLRFAAGTAHACALTYDTLVHCWGANDRGQLGDGTFVDRSSPVAVTF
jgi:alpha-tubulin suppressor-like RCC1 family protein